MGGCAHHAMLDHAGDSKCSTFRTTYREQVEEYAVSCRGGVKPTGCGTPCCR